MLFSQAVGSVPNKASSGFSSDNSKTKNGGNSRILGRMRRWFMSVRLSRHARVFWNLSYIALGQRLHHMICVTYTFCIGIDQAVGSVPS